MIYVTRVRIEWNIVAATEVYVPRTAWNDAGSEVRYKIATRVRTSATRDISLDVPVKYDTRRYINSLKGPM